MDSIESDDIGLIPLEVDGYSLQDLRNALRRHTRNSTAENEARCFYVVEVPDSVDVQALAGFTPVQRISSWGWNSLPDVPRLLGFCEKFAIVRSKGAGDGTTDPWMVIYRRRALPSVADPMASGLEDVACPLDKFNARDVAPMENQKFSAMRASELGRRYPLMARIY